MRNHTAIDDSELQKYIRDSGIFRIFPVILQQYHSNVEILEVLCNVISNVCANNMTNRYIMGSIGVPESLAEVYIKHLHENKAQDPVTGEYSELALAIQEAMRDVCEENEENRKAAEAVINQGI